ncbi:unnamed protein product [Parnassius apollo]|uniref:(apollo) hypothetical protein n=1 Tax=Parnassius apollo TaxID=110799 RepID=A0A8S3YA39_PARAO|nr:unnamed protein product [Parnassius apollo]
MTRERVRLCLNAYPTLFNVSEMSSGIPQTAARIVVETEMESDVNLALGNEMNEKINLPSTSRYASGTMEVPSR